MNAATPNPALELTRQARRLLGLALVPLGLLMLVLALVHARQEWDSRLTQASTQLRLQRQAFDTLARDADRHVAELARAYLQATEALPPQAALRNALQARADGDGHTLD